MKIIAHRGVWKQDCEKNTLNALFQALNNGWGVETDIRDYGGKLVISHDMPMTDNITLDMLLQEYQRLNVTSTLALNIKSDGLHLPLQRLLAQYEIEHYFCFDMSVPDTLPYLCAEMKVAARLSEYETEGFLTASASAVWIDSFLSTTLPIDTLLKHLDMGKLVCLVSPELHGRDPALFWRELACLPAEILYLPSLMLCTDFPERAQEIFA